MLILALDLREGLQSFDHLLVLQVDKSLEA